MDHNTRWQQGSGDAAAPSEVSNSVGAASTRPDTDGDTVPPRPQLLRRQWHSLNGVWEFTYDDDNVGLGQHWESSGSFAHAITVPYPPESEASGIADTEFHPIMWYRRQLTTFDLIAAGLGEQGWHMLLHFGAVDYHADVWLNGRLIGSHDGGHTPFVVDLSPALTSTSREPWDLVVRAADEPQDVAQPRGKQDWQLEPHGIWYHRTSGIWQSVWLEAVPDVYVTQLAWSCDLPAATVTLDLELNAAPGRLTVVAVRLSHRDQSLAAVQVEQHQQRARLILPLARQTNGQAYESILWTPETPTLIDARVSVSVDNQNVDAIVSYLGLRSVGWADRHVMLNDRPYYLRAVLAQNYWPQTNLAAPDDDALRAEVQLIKDLGFNSARIHQKIEDPRFMYWADKLGLMVWIECPSVYETSTTATERTIREWLDVIRRDRSHPSVVAWVPYNESWGIQHVSHDPAQLDLLRAAYHLTKALDPTRLVISNDGWEHADSDLWTIHDYGTTYAEVATNYADAAELDHLLDGIGPLGRRMRLLPHSDHGQPIVVSEFGGISYASHSAHAWGYATTETAEQYEKTLRDLFMALQSSPVLAGFCYTQLTDTLQEANGLCGPDRRPKLPTKIIRDIVLGRDIDTSTQRRPRKPVEKRHPSTS